MLPRLPAVLVPTFFVLIWSTGFIMARAVAPYAEPLTFLSMRFALAAASLAGAAWVARAAWPSGPSAWTNAAIAGALLHGAYLGGVFWAISLGLPAGITSLIVGAQPLLTALLARPLLGEEVSGRRWLGVCLGFLGLALVLGPRTGSEAGYPTAALLAAFAGLLGITAGTLWQKRTGAATDLRTGTALQYAGAMLVVLPGALLTERMEIVSTPALWLGLAWAVGPLSIGAVALLLVMLKRGEAVAVSSLLFLVPPTTMVMGYLAFGEAITPVQVAGMAVSALGVALASRG